MRRNIATTLAVLSLPFSADLAMAKGPAPEGTTATIDFTITVKEQSKTQWSNSAIERVLKAQCTVVAGPALQVGWNGPSAEQQAATEQAQANAQTFQQNYAPSDALMANMEALAEKCGDDEACLTAGVMALSQNAEIQSMAAKSNQAKADMAGLTPDLGPVRYQTWNSQGCSGTLSANDTETVSDPGGEGGYGAFTDTTTVQGSAPMDPAGLVMTVETDAIGNTTTYRIAAAGEVMLPSNSSMKGPGQARIGLLGSTAMPDVIGPIKGFLGKQSTKIAGEEGTITLSVQSH